jgi:predicted PurR-regulated permease PerM
VAEPLDDPTKSRAGIVESLATALRQPSFLRVMLFLATTVAVLVGMRLGAPILNPILFAVVLSLLFSPIYAWLRRHRIPTPLALIIMLVGLIVLFGTVFLILSISIARFSGDIGSYTKGLNGQLNDLQDLAKSLGLSNVNIKDAVKPSALAGAIGSVLDGIADFLSKIFLILIIVLFLLAEGPAMMGRLRASVGVDHPDIPNLSGDALDRQPHGRGRSRYRCTSHRGGDGRAYWMNTKS